MFQRIGAAAYKPNLNNTLAICKALKNPETKFKSIHVAGTNGKGSSSHMLASIFQKAGYKTGLYTSPHLKDFRERIRINGKMISKKAVIDFVKQHKALFEKIEPSFFEWTVGLAFDYFAKEKVDIAIIETGLGGRLDSTNVIKPEVCLITNIGWDHMNLLGDTLEKIAGEKAGIIKENIPVVVSEMQEETAPVFFEKAKKERSALHFASEEMAVEEIKSDFNKLELAINKGENQRIYTLDLTGQYQKKNICGVLKVVEIMRKKGWEIPETKVKQGLKSVKKSTGLMGRWEVISNRPLTICDTGHNLEGIQMVMQSLEKIKYKNLHIVLGMVNDKDPSKVLRQFPKQANYYFTKAAVPRALNEIELQKAGKSFGLKGDCYSTVKEAIKAARKKAQKDDLIFIGGSTFVVGDALVDSIKISN